MWVIVWSFINPNLGGSFEVEGGKITHCLKPARIMLESLNLVDLYAHLVL